MSFEQTIESNSFKAYFDYLKFELNSRSILHLGTDNSKTSKAIIKFVTLLGTLSSQVSFQTRTSLLVFLELIDLKNNSHEKELRQCFLKTKAENKADVERARTRALQVWTLVIAKTRQIMQEILFQNLQRN